MLCKVLTISGFDNYENSGIQADLKTFSAFGCYGTSILTGLSIQNNSGSRYHYPIPLKAIEEQLNFAFEAIKPAAIKIGRLYNQEAIELITSFLKPFADKIPIVLDPVINSENMGHLSWHNDMVSEILDKLFPLATLVTLNPAEAFVISGISIDNKNAMLDAGRKVMDLGAHAVLIKGSHLNMEECPDALLYDQCLQWFNSPSIKLHKTYGTGCTLSAAITSCLALKQDLESACELSKLYVSNAIEASQNKALVDENYQGTIHHFYHLWPTLYLIKKDINHLNM